MRKLFALSAAVAPPTEPFDVASLESDLRQIAQGVGHPRNLDSPEDYAPKQLPDYITPDATAPEIGRLTAEAVVKQYEAAAQSIEAMAKELVDLHKRMEAETVKVHEVLDILTATAKRAREKGRLAYEKVEAMAKLTDQVRASAEEISNKLALP